MRELEKTKLKNCGECGKEFQTMTGYMMNKCFECRLLMRIDRVLYHFGIK